MHKRVDILIYPRYNKNLVMSVFPVQCPYQRVVWIFFLPPPPQNFKIELNLFQT